MDLSYWNALKLAAMIWKLLLVLSIQLWSEDWEEPLLLVVGPVGNLGLVLEPESWAWIVDASASSKVTWLTSTAMGELLDGPVLTEASSRAA